VLSDINYTLNIKDIKSMKAILKIQSVALKAIHDFFEEENFIQLLPVMLSRYTDPLLDGDKKLEPAEINYNGQKLKLTQSMILQKQVAIGLGIERLFVVSPNIRLELPELAKSQNHCFEFTQIDFEIANAQLNDIFKFVERLLRRVRIDVISKAENELKTLNRDLGEWNESFPILTSHDLIVEYGESWKEETKLDYTTPIWIVCHDRNFYDRVDRSTKGMHIENFDLYYPEGFGGAMSGGEREFNYQNLLYRMKEKEINRFEFSEYLLIAEKNGLRPSAGGGLGVERLVRYLSGFRDIGDVQLFKRIPGNTIKL